MSKDLAYYRALAYEREWLPRDDESGRYFVVRLRDIPEIYGTGFTRQEALAALWSAFDDHMNWCLEEGVDIPEPAVVSASEPMTIEVQVERIHRIPSDPEFEIRQPVVGSLTRAAERTESFRGIADTLQEIPALA